MKTESMAQMKLEIGKLIAGLTVKKETIKN